MERKLQNSSFSFPTIISFFCYLFFPRTHATMLNQNYYRNRGGTFNLPTADVKSELHKGKGVRICNRGGILLLYSREFSHFFKKKLWIKKKMDRYLRWGHIRNNYPVHDCTCTGPLISVFLLHFSGSSTPTTFNQPTPLDTVTKRMHSFCLFETSTFFQARVFAKKRNRD